MNVEINRGVGRIFCTASLIALCAGHATAQQPASDPVLKGPTVQDNGMPGERGSFSKGAKAGKPARAEGQLPPRMFLGALNVLRGEKAEPNVRLTAEQDEKIRAIQKEFGASVEAYMKEHGPEVRELVPQLPPEARREAQRRVRAVFQGAGADRPAKADKQGAGDEMMTDAPPATPEQQEAAKARLKELFEGAPSAKDAQARVWTVLTGSQRTLVEAEIKRLREEVAKGPKPLTKPMNVDGESKQAPDPEVGQISPNLRKRLQSLPPEQREEAIRRLQERRNAGKGGEPKPAPDMDDVKVPPASAPK